MTSGSQLFVCPKTKSFLRGLLGVILILCSGICHILAKLAVVFIPVASKVIVVCGFGRFKIGGFRDEPEDAIAQGCSENLLVIVDGHIYLTYAEGGWLPQRRVRVENIVAAHLYSMKRASVVQVARMD